jgi:hypothetical protein
MTEREALLKHIRATKALRYSDKIADLARTDARVESYSFEGTDGHWIYLKAGWCSEPGQHAIHEYSARDALRAFAWIEKCEPGCTCEDES